MITGAYFESGQKQKKSFVIVAVLLHKWTFVYIECYMAFQNRRKTMVIYVSFVRNVQVL